VVASLPKKAESPHQATLAAEANRQRERYPKKPLQPTPAAEPFGRRRARAPAFAG